MDKLMQDSFLDSIKHSLVADENIYIIKPTKYSIEDYAFMLEGVFYKDYGLNLRGYPITYVDIRDQKKDPYTFDDGIIIYDPLCWFEEIEELNNRLHKIGEIVNGRN